MSSWPAPRLALLRSSAHSWRLCDESWSEGDPRYLVAYVEQRGKGAYEVTWVGFGAGTATFRILDDLFRAALAFVSAPRAARSMKPNPIASRPPWPSER